MNRKNLIMTLIAVITVLAMCLMVGCKADKPAGTTSNLTQGNSGSIEIDVTNGEDGEDDVPEDTTEATDATVSTGDGEDEEATANTESTKGEDNTGNDVNTGNDETSGGEDNSGNQGGNQEDSPVIADDEKPDVEVDFDDLFN